MIRSNFDFLGLDEMELLSLSGWIIWCSYSTIYFVLYLKHHRLLDYSSEG
uniref:Transmembrane protein n=1 Tax=Medicago truncatula TaxID=3880 RepID=I3SMP8_MEDTR|nr:unknown [Medicago truncatula]